MEQQGTWFFGDNYFFTNGQDAQHPEISSPFSHNVININSWPSIIFFLSLITKCSFGAMVATEVGICLAIGGSPLRAPTPSVSVVVSLAKTLPCWRWSEWPVVRYSSLVFVELPKGSWCYYPVASHNQCENVCMNGNDWNQWKKSLSVLKSPRRVWSHYMTLCLSSLSVLLNWSSHFCQCQPCQWEVLWVLFLSPHIWFWSGISSFCLFGSSWVCPPRLLRVPSRFHRSGSLVVRSPICSPSQGSPSNATQVLHYK